MIIVARILSIAIMALVIPIARFSREVSSLIFAPGHLALILTESGVPSLSHISSHCLFPELSPLQSMAEAGFCNKKPKLRAAIIINDIVRILLFIVLLYHSLGDFWLFWYAMVKMTLWH